LAKTKNPPLQDKKPTEPIISDKSPVQNQTAHFPNLSQDDTLKPPYDLTFNKQDALKL